MTGALTGALSRAGRAGYAGYAGTACGLIRESRIFRGAIKEAMKRATTIHRKDAFRLLEDRRAHNLRLWKLSTGDILEYEGAVCVGGHKRGGTHRVRLPRSGVLREFRDISLFEIDGLKIYW